MQSEVKPQSIQLPLLVYDMSLLLLKDLNPQVRKVLPNAYKSAQSLLNSVGVEKFAGVVALWERLNDMKLSNDQKIFMYETALNQQVIQIVHDINVESSVVNFFVWLMVAHANGVSGKVLEGMLYRIYKHWKEIRHQYQKF
jgi:hypothetical protein